MLHILHERRGCERREKKRPRPFAKWKQTKESTLEPLRPDVIHCAWNYHSHRQGSYILLYTLRCLLPRTRILWTNLSIRTEISAIN